MTGNIAPPNVLERDHVARFLLTDMILIGSVDEIWTHQTAFRALATWRLCIQAIQRLVAARQSVLPSYVKAVVMQLPDVVDSPFALDEIAEFMVTDERVRRYWDGLVLDRNYPLRCPLCKVGAAYVGMNEVDCKSRCADLKRR